MANSENKLQELVCDCLNHRYDSCTRGCCQGSNLGPSDPKAGILVNHSAILLPQNLRNDNNNNNNAMNSKTYLCTLQTDLNAMEYSSIVDFSLHAVIGCTVLWTFFTHSLTLCCGYCALNLVALVHTSTVSYQTNTLLTRRQNLCRTNVYI